MQPLEVTKYFAETHPYLLTDARPHPFMGDRNLEAVSQAIVEGNSAVVDFLLNWEAPHMNGEKVIANRLKAHFEPGADRHLISLNASTLVGGAGSPEMVHTLVAAGADVNAQFHFPRDSVLAKVLTPVLFATVAAGSKCPKDQFLAIMPGMTPLHDAAFKGNLEVVQTLLALGADPRIRNTYGWSPLDVAELRHFDAVAAELKQALAKYPAERSWWSGQFCCVAEKGADEVQGPFVPEAPVPVEDLAEKRGSKAVSVASTADS